MREIKFRAFDLKQKVMRVVWDIGWKGWDSPEEVINYVRVEGDGTYELQSHEVILMQYTNLKDKNGNDVYEEDILINPCVSGHGFMKWDEKGGWCIEYMGEVKSCSHDKTCKTWEIVGNAYEGIKNEKPRILHP